MISNVSKFSNKGKRSRLSTKKKLLEAIREDFRNHIMATKFFVDLAVENYQKTPITKRKNDILKCPFQIDFSGNVPRITTNKEAYFITEKDKTFMVKEALKHSLSIYLIWCFEEFEIFLKNIYSFIGFMDNLSWQGNDFGSTILKETELYTFEDYQEKVKKNNKLSSSELIKKIKTLCPIIKKWETSGNSKFQTYYWRVAFIAKLRHLLVHNTGKIDDIESVKKNLRNELGLSNNHNFEKFLQIVCQKYLKQEEGTQYEILLCDTSSSSIAEKCNSLIDVLQIYSEIIYEATKQDFCK